MNAVGGMWWDRDPVAIPSGIKRKLLQNDLGYVHELCRNLYTIVYNFLYTADCVLISTQSFKDVMTSFHWILILVLDCRFVCQKCGNSIEIQRKSTLARWAFTKRFPNFRYSKKPSKVEKVMKNSWQALNRNWQTGKFKTTIHSLEFDDWNGYFDADDFLISAGHCGYFHLDDDYILKEKKVGPMLLKVLDRRTMKIQRVGR